MSYIEEEYECFGSPVEIEGKSKEVDCFTVEGDEEVAGRRENGDAWACTLIHTQHRRSKSASDRKLDLSRGGVSCAIRKNLNELAELPPSTRSCREQNSLHEFPNYNKDAVSNHRASLEKDIEELQLRLQQEKSMQMLLERAIGRASSTLSPGHRHVSTQTRELIAEIELLEEEVSNREQHVLSLYRSIFENSISRPHSKQSSSMTSPAHTKNESRRHPSIISSAFCSSKKFPLRPFQALATINDSRKRNLLQSKTRHATLSGGKANIHFEKASSDLVMVQEHALILGKSSVLRTLKDHLYQCPSKLSEEMVGCMAAVYCWLRSTASANPEQNHSLRDWSCKSMVEISWISTDKNNFPHASYAINNYRVLVEQLERVDVSHMETNAQTAFWINIYNSLIMHAYLAYGIPHRSLRRLSLFCKAAYNVGGHVINANAIEHSIFCLRTPRIGRWLETILSTAMRKKSGEEKQLISSKFGLQKSKPLVCFALCTGASSDPVLKVYTASNIEEELEVVKREFLQANIVVKKSKKVFLPKVLERFAKEASMTPDELVQWVTDNVDNKLRDSIQKCIDSRSNRKASQIIEWLPHSSKFRYMFSKDLTEKPRWV